MNICVFCSSSEGLAQEYYDIGHEVGRLIAKGFVTKERLRRIGFCNSAAEVMEYIEGV